MEKESIKLLSQKYSTPFYIFDIDALRNRIDGIKKRISSSACLCFAVKANPFIVSSILSTGISRIEVCSPGELEICIKNNIPPDRIILSGINKDIEFIARAVKYGVDLFSAESPRQMMLLDEVSLANKKHISVFLRLTSGNQFGMDERDLKSIVSERGKYKFCSIIGIHYFAGTQRNNLKQQETDLLSLQQLISSLKKEYGYNTDELEYGPGLFYSYYDGKSDDYSQLDELVKIIKNTVSPDVKIVLEMGRYISASCGTYCTTVIDTKQSGNQNIAVVDGGINHISYYGSMMGMKTPRFSVLRGVSETIENKRENWLICGSLCTTSDVLLRKIETEELKCGDIFVFQDAGAYSMTEGLTLFLSRDIPKVFKLENGSISLIREALHTYEFNN